METRQPQDPRVARANSLYWKSDRSVNQIADEMGLSKGMLYGLIRPLQSGLPCPRCSAALQYGNRTARERRLLRCPNCGLESTDDEVRREWNKAAAVAPGGKLVLTPPSDDPLTFPDSDPSERTRRDPVLIGAGLLLIAAGLWLFQSLRRR